MRTQIVKAEVRRLVRQAPFRPFSLNLENGEQLIIEHPENIAFDPGTNGSEGSPEFHVVSSDLRYVSSFECVTSVAVIDTGEHLE